jgi:hypothetical protein
MATADDVHQMLFNMLSLYNVNFNVVNAGDSRIFEVSKFGVKIIYLDGQLFDTKAMKDWHVAYVHPDYSVAKARESVLWGLVKGGYFHYLRHNYKNTFNKMLTFEGFDRMISKERKRIYKNKPKYNYIRELMKNADKEGSMYTLSMDPGFFDFIME